MFADIVSPGTISNLRHNPAVEVNVVDPITRCGYRFKGRAEVHVDGAVFDAVISQYRTNGSIAATRAKSVALIAVESAAPLVSPAYDTGLTVDEVVDRSLRGSIPFASSAQSTTSNADLSSPTSVRGRSATICRDVRWSAGFEVGRTAHSPTPSPAVMGAQRDPGSRKAMISSEPSSSLGRVSNDGCLPHCSI